MKTLLRLLPLLLALPAALPAADNSDWHLEFPAFKIAGNLHWVGTADLAIYLVHTPEGNILINSNFPFNLIISVGTIPF